MNITLIATLNDLIDQLRDVAGADMPVLVDDGSGNLRRVTGVYSVPAEGRYVITIEEVD